MWLPGYEQMPLPGVPGTAYDEYDDPKCMWHSTQGTSIEGAVSAYRAYPPHLIVDPWRKRKVQHIPLDRAAYALWNADADDSRCVQVEVVGYSEDAPNWPDDVLRWLAEEVARPLHEYFGVPYVAAPQGFKAPGDVDYVLASASSPLRFTQAGLDSFSGHLAHQHSPGDSHWDVPLAIEKVLSYARGSEGDDDMVYPITGAVHQDAPDWLEIPLPPVRQSVPLPANDKACAWVQLLCPQYDVEIFGVYRQYHGGSELLWGPGVDPRRSEQPGVKPVLLKPDTYKVFKIDKAGSIGVAVLYRGPVALSALVTLSPQGL